MKALNVIKFPRMLKLSRSVEERQFDESNQFRLNQNFRSITDSIVSIEKSIASLPDKIKDEIDTHSDYVTESDVDGMWTYRKWNSGVLECWGATLDIQKNFSTASGALYVSTHSLPLPADLFTSITSAQISIVSSGAYCCASLSSADSSAVSVRLLSTTSVSASLKLYAFIVGRWRE